MSLMKLASALELPEEAVMNTPLVTLRGKDSVTVENFKRVLGFDRCETDILTKCGRLVILGEGLFLEYLRKDVIKIRGRIFEVKMK